MRRALPFLLTGEIRLSVVDLAETAQKASIDIPPGQRLLKKIFD